MNNTILNPANAFGGLMEELFNGNYPSVINDRFFPDNWKKDHNFVPVNITETEAGYQMEVTTPGLKKEDLKVNVNENLLTISFEKDQEKKEEKKEKESKILRKEFQLRSFSRSFKLGEKVDAERISARYEDGILFLDIPKKEAAKATSKAIEIK